MRWIGRGDSLPIHAVSLCMIGVMGFQKGTSCIGCKMTLGAIEDASWLMNVEAIFIQKETPICFVVW